MHIEYDKNRNEYKIRYRERQEDGSIKYRAIRKNFKTEKSAKDYWKRSLNQEQMDIFDYLELQNSFHRKM